MTVRQLIQYLMDLALEDPKILNLVVFTVAESTSVFALRADAMSINHELKRLEIQA